MRPSIDRPRIASPAYSMTWPVPPAVPILPMIARIMSLAVTPSGRSPVDRDAHVLRALLDQRLGGQHVLDLGGADAEGERPEGAVGRGVAVAADDGHAGLGEALLGADDVDDALADVVACRSRSMPNSRAVLLQRLDLDAAILARRCPGERSVVGTLWSGTARVASGPAHLAAGQAQALEGLRAGHLVHQMAVDVEEAGAVRPGGRPGGCPRSCRTGSWPRAIAPRSAAGSAMSAAAGRWLSAPLAAAVLRLAAPRRRRAAPRRSVARARRCAPPCRPAAQIIELGAAHVGRGAPARCWRCAGCRAGRRARRPRRRRSCAR